MRATPRPDHEATSTGTVSITGAAREPYLSHLRASLTGLVICHHAAITLGAAGDWYYVIPPPPGSFAPLVLTCFTALNQAFFMALFFFIAGYFTPDSLDRKGPARYLQDRCIRLGVPLVVYYFFLNPCAVYMAYRCGSPEVLLNRLDTRGDLSPEVLAAREAIIRRFAGTRGDNLPAFFHATFPDSCGPGPLWFTEILLIFTVAYVAWRVLYPRRSRPMPLPGSPRVLAFMCAMGVAAFAIRLVFPVGAFLPVLGIQPAHFPLYVALFLVGIAARPGQWLEQLSRRVACPWVAVAIATCAMIPLLLVAGGGASGGVGAFLGGWTWQAALYALLEPVLCVGISVGLLTAFRARWNRETPAWRFAADSAYAAYIIHPFFVIGAACLMRDWTVDPLLKFPVLCLLSTTSAFVAASFIRRIPLFRRVL